MRTVTQRGLDAIKRHEGLRLQPYRDVAGLLTIGYGHLLTRSELSSGKIMMGHDAVRWGNGISMDVAEYLLRNDILHAEHAVEGDDNWLRQKFSEPLTDAQFDALVSFVFNVGVGAYQSSTLRKRLLLNKREDVPQQMRRWNRAAGVVVPGLVRRREEEARLWEVTA